VLPRLVSTDDGYSDGGAREDLLKAGVEVVCINGAKGKKITGAEQWNRPEYRAARANRSAVESLMFTLKDGYEFGQLLRRERENVRAELTEKVLAYNISHIIETGTPFEIGGLTIRSGELLHGDLHGVQAIPLDIASQIPPVAAKIAARERA
jgi:hypothetical protein